jgi:hypothetical protein
MAAESQWITYSCGCVFEPGRISYCQVHGDWGCHSGQAVERWCPPCYRARLLGAIILPSATPTRKRSL